MKKLICLLTAMLLALSLAACGGGAEETTAAPAETTAAAETTKAPEKESTVALTGETLESDLWTLIYDADVWTYEEDDFYTDEDYSEITLYIPEGEDDVKVAVDLWVSIEDPYDFRESLYEYGIDEYEYAVNNAYPLTKIGGVDCIMEEVEYWGEEMLLCLGRVENASATVFIKITEDFKHEEVSQLLAGLNIHVEDIGNEDYPWYWEGEPFSAAASSATIGGHTIKAEWIPFDEPVITHQTFDHFIAVNGEEAYIILDEHLKEYTYDGASLTFVSDLFNDDTFCTIQADDSGAFWLSDFGSPLYKVKDGALAHTYDYVDKAVMHPSGEWGISWFSDNNCETITISGDTMSLEEFAFEHFDTMSYLFMDEKNVYACASDAYDGEHKVFVYNMDGEFRFALAGENDEGLGCITYVTETENGFIGLDGNMRQILFWTPDGDFIGALDDSDLFGTHYPWFCAADKLDDGSLLIIMTEDREDQSAMELVAFKLSGF